MSETKRVIQGVVCVLLAVTLSLLLLVRMRAAWAVETPSASPVPYEVLASAVIDQTPLPTDFQTPVVTPNPNGAPRVDITSWQFTLASAEHPIGQYVPPELSTLEGDRQFDSRAVVSLQNFIDAARAEGLSVCLSSAYRPYSEQQYLFDRKTAQLGGDAEAAAKIVLPAGTSEHQLGLCADITDQYYETKTVELENTALYQWMVQHCAEFGFILRYPADKEEITGVMYEPWHFRYVGEDAAEYIMEHGICLEEFIALYD